MNIENMISELEDKRNKLEVAINSLRALTPHRGRPKTVGTVRQASELPGPVIWRKKRNLSPAGRRAISQAVKRYWAKRRKEEAKAA
jgi:hypothetical protein